MQKYGHWGKQEVILLKTMHYFLLVASRLTAVPSKTKQTKKTNRGNTIYTHKQCQRIRTEACLDCAIHIIFSGSGTVEPHGKCEMEF